MSIYDRSIFSLLFAHKNSHHAYVPYKLVDRLLDEINTRNTLHVINRNLFIKLMTEHEFSDKTAEFIQNANSVRDFLMRRHHNIL